MSRLSLETRSLPRGHLKVEGIARLVFDTKKFSAINAQLLALFFPLCKVAVRFGRY